MTQPVQTPPTWNPDNLNQPCYRVGVYIDLASVPLLTPTSAYTSIIYEIQSGQLPPGLTLSASGIIRGTPEAVVTVDPITVYQASFRITGYANSSTLELFRTCVFSVVNNTVFFTQDMVNPFVDYLDDHYRYTLRVGTADVERGLRWHLKFGKLPNNASLSNRGQFIVYEDKFVKPFIRSEFVPANLEPPAASEENWQTFKQEFFSRYHEYDYQVVVELIDLLGHVYAAHTVRIVHFYPPVYTDWFYLNRNYLSFDPNQLYFYFITSEYEEISWQTNENLGTAINGELSKLLVQAQTKNQKALSYELATTVLSRTPQGVVLRNNGLLTGRFNYRCFEDDPGFLPVNNIYNFTARAYTENRLSYADKKFTLQVLRINRSPVDKIWVRAHPNGRQRTFLKSILEDQTLFPDNLIYRLNDPWHGRSGELKMLFVTGLLKKPLSVYLDMINNNFYNKRLYFGQPEIAVALNDNNEIIYEVVYLPMVDLLLGRDPISKIRTGPPESIDLLQSNLIRNTYKEDQASFSVLRVNSVDNMIAQVSKYIGYNNDAVGAIPEWMTSLQPVPGSDQYISLEGFVLGVVLAYCKPGCASKIKHRIANVNFNQIEFEFDRLQLENYQSNYYDQTTLRYTPAIGAIFDDGATLFDAGGTAVVDGMEYYEDPGTTDKYLLFPKFGVFK